MIYGSAQPLILDMLSLMPKELVYYHIHYNLVENLVQNGRDFKRLFNLK